jgi:hypothetical protein
MNKVKVYRFQIWDQNMGENVWTPRSATLDAIKRVNGFADFPSEQTVDDAELDGNGFYPKRRQYKIELAPHELPDDIRNVGAK